MQNRKTSDLKTHQESDLMDTYLALNTGNKKVILFEKSKITNFKKNPLQKSGITSFFEEKIPVNNIGNFYTLAVIQNLAGSSFQIIRLPQLHEKISINTSLQHP